MRQTLCLFTVILALACNCRPKEEPVQEEPAVAENAADMYLTTADGMKRMSRSKLKFGNLPATEVRSIYLDHQTTYQSIVGFGPAITGATGYNLLRMSADDRHAILKEIFDPSSGQGVSLIRVSIGSSDFGLDEYTCCDKEGIDNFDIHALDKRDVIPVLKEIYQINPNVQIIGSPWSAPRWMKRRSTTDDRDYYSWTSGSLKPSCYQDYALYFVKWIQAMEAEGFKIHAITVQNEPLNHGNSMSMYMTWEEQRDFIKTALGPAFESAGIKAKILLFDHNYNYDNVSSQNDYPMHILEDPEAAKYVAGTAWHNYGGHYNELDDVVKRCKGKDIYFTEASIGTWNYDFGSCLINDFESIFIQTMKRGNRGVTLWNLMLDDKRAPNRNGGCQTCYGAVEVSSKSYKVIDRKSHYYNIAHASQVIKPGAVRIATRGYEPIGVSYLAFRNPDNSYALIFNNSSAAEQQLIVITGSNSLTINLPARAIASVLWKDQP